jgi:nucleoside-diphosphate-sugar epimerase
LLPIHVQDAVGAFETALSVGSAGETFWVGPEAAVSLSEIVAMVSRLAGSAVRIERVDLPALPGDTLALVPQAALPGWSPSVSLEEGIQRMVEVYRASGERSQ